MLARGHTGAISALISMPLSRRTDNQLAALLRSLSMLDHAGPLLTAANLDLPTLCTALALRGSVHVLKLLHDAKMLRWRSHKSPRKALLGGLQRVCVASTDDHPEVAYNLTSAASPFVRLPMPTDCCAWGEESSQVHPMP